MGSRRNKKSQLRDYKNEVRMFKKFLLLTVLVSGNSFAVTFCDEANPCTVGTCQYYLPNHSTGGGCGYGFAIVNNGKENRFSLITGIQDLGAVNVNPEKSRTDTEDQYLEKNTDETLRD